MTDEQAERAIRELRAIRGAIFFVAVVLAVMAGLQLGEALTGRDPTAAMTNELSAIRGELMLWRTETGRPRGGAINVLPNLPQQADPGK
jgi:hypothetical protein